MADAFGFTVPQTGLMLAAQLPPGDLARIDSGELKGFSIEGVGIA